MKVGVAGTIAAGKGEVVRLLERRGFYPASLSDVIRAELARDGLEPTRDHMIERGRALRSASARPRSPSAFCACSRRTATT
jgi:dephospho-CoA kinase